MIKEAIIKLSKRQDLTYEEAEQVMNEIMENTASDVQKAAYLTALSMKGETIDEITASAAAMRVHGKKLLHNMDVLEIVGTVRAAMVPILSISPPPPPLSLPPAAFPLPNTATGQLPPDQEPLTFWKLWVSRSTFPRNRANSFLPISISASFSPRNTILP